MVKKMSLLLIFVGVLGLLIGCSFKTETYKVSFETNEGTLVHTIVIEKDKTITNMPPTTKEGYTFEGWFKEAELTNAWLTTDTVIMNITLYAKWSEN